MREDALGLFWEDHEKVRLTKPPPPPRTPPPRTWELPGYLPGLEEAQRFNVPLFTVDELVRAAMAREPLVFDCEVFENYALFAFMSVVSGKVFYMEMHEYGELDLERLDWILHNFLIFTFNGIYFDAPMAALALAGWTCSQLKQATNAIILSDIKPWQVLRSAKVKRLDFDHVDLIGVAPLSASLKVYGGRMHVPKIQELPFKHDTVLTGEQMDIVRWYCINSDLVATAFLFAELLPQVELRASMSDTYGVDLRSKSDAQVAEAILCAELQRLSYQKAQRPELPEGFTFHYRVPDYIEFESTQLQAALDTIGAATFFLNEGGEPVLPEAVANLLLSIGSGVYQMGVGGLHSTETCQAHVSDDEMIVVDRDVISYYPNIILNQELYPSHLGRSFLDVYRSLVMRRQKAKKEKNKVEADTLKIVVNGSFGKLGNKWSPLYAPDLMVQVTLSGQLSLLMLIEQLELAGIPVVSGNTDGVLIKCPRSKRDEMERVVAGWEHLTGFKTEETEYRGVFARDVNNYIAVKAEGGTKVKGVYAERGSAGDSILSKNPVNLICNDAASAFLEFGTPISETIRNCGDVRRFITIRTVKGGAVKDGEYLGKAIRWYYAQGEEGEIIYASNGHSVPLSKGARPLMQLPEAFPADMDFARYEADALDILREIGVEVVDSPAVEA